MVAVKHWDRAVSPLSFLICDEIWACGCHLFPMLAQHSCLFLHCEGTGMCLTGMSCSKETF